MMNNFKYPISGICSKIGSQYWEDPHSIIVMNGGIGFKSADNGSASLVKQKTSSFGSGFCGFCVAVVVKLVGCPVYTHSLEYEFSSLYLMI